jgi:hypothetical protein
MVAPASASPHNAVTETSMALSGHVVGLLKEYMHDLVVQAEQEAAAHEAFGFSKTSYLPDQAIADLLAILDDRIESEGIQVGLPENVLHQMWTLCNEARTQVTDQVWLHSNMSGRPASKAQVRQLTYQALIQFLEATL